jgi:hypothetical protein
MFEDRDRRLDLAGRLDETMESIRQDLDSLYELVGHHSHMESIISAFNGMRYAVADLVVKLSL